MYAKIIYDVVIEYPYSITKMKQEYRNVSFPSDIESDATSLVEYNVYTVLPSVRPAFNRVTHKLVETTPVFNGTAWVQTWSVIECDAGELAENVARVKQDISNQVQLRLDTFAQTRNYDSILSAATYATSTVAIFANEGQYAITARDSTWAKMYDIMSEVELSIRAMPESYADIEADLPVLAWPAIV